MMRSILTLSIVLMLAGCINTPNTKALITPLGGIGIHSFAPRDSQRLHEANPERMAQLDTQRARTNEDEDAGTN